MCPDILFAGSLCKVALKGRKGKRSSTRAKSGPKANIIILYYDYRDRNVAIYYLIIKMS